MTQKLILQFKADVLIKDTRLGGDLMMAASATCNGLSENVKIPLMETILHRVS